eukprot:GABU01004204.1.p2 GENE.GABU01004204.1~~GABU01004204.1.p2  ORF type:complete len:109 (-),score=14.75 GABU01004204.1:183-509(-)
MKYPFWKVRNRVAGTPATAIHLPNCTGASCRNLVPRKLSLTFQKILLKPDINSRLLCELNRNQVRKPQLQKSWGGWKHNQMRRSELDADSLRNKPAQPQAGQSFGSTG